MLALLLIAHDDPNTKARSTILALQPVCSLMCIYVHVYYAEKRRMPIISGREQHEISASRDVFNIKSVLSWYPFDESHGVSATSFQALNE